MLGNAEGSLIQYAPQDLGGQCKHSYRPRSDISDLCTFFWKYNYLVEL